MKETDEVLSCINSKVTVKSTREKINKTEKIL